MAKRISANEASRHLGDVIDEVLRGEDFVITRYGKPEVVVVDFLKYKEMEDALERTTIAQVESDPETLTSLERGMQDIKEGRYVAEEELDAYLARKRRG